MASFFDSCVNYELRPLPAAERTVFTFHRIFVYRDLEYFTVNNYVAVIATPQHCHDRQSPNLYNFNVKDALSGAKRRRFERQNKRSVMTLSQRQAILSHSYSTPKAVHVTFWCACLTRLFLLMQISFRKRNLRRKGVHFTDVKYNSAVAPLKSNRFLRQKITITIHYAQDDQLCPVEAMQRMLSSQSFISKFAFRLLLKQPTFSSITKKCANKRQSWFVNRPASLQNMFLPTSSVEMEQQLPHQLESLRKNSDPKETVSCSTGTSVKICGNISQQKWR